MKDVSAGALKFAPAKDRELGGDPTPHVKDELPKPVVTMPAGPIAFWKTPLLLPSNGVPNEPRGRANATKPANTLPMDDLVFMG